MGMLVHIAFGTLFMLATFLANAGSVGIVAPVKDSSVPLLCLT